MKQFLLSFLFLGCFMSLSTAQITIANTDFLLSTTGRDSAMTKFLKKTGATIPTQGLNQTWDYSNLRDSLPDPYYYGFITQPVTSPRPTAVASATLEANHVTNFQLFQIPTRTYYQYNATGYGPIGDSMRSAGFPLTPVTGGAADSLKFPAQVRAFSTPIRYLRFPMTMSTSWTSSNRIVTNFVLKVLAFGLNDVAGYGVLNTTSRDTIVGWGTLKLRHPSTGATLSFNALLGTYQTTNQDSFYLGGAPAPSLLLDAFGLVQGRRDTTTRFYFYGAGMKAFLLNINVNNSATQIGSIFRAILPNLGLTTKNNELIDLEVSTKVFPNPTTEGVTFEFDKTSTDDWRVFIYNAAGQIIKNEYVKAPIGKVSHTTRFDSNLANGVYYYQIIDNNSLIRNSNKLQLLR